MKRFFSAAARGLAGITVLASVLPIHAVATAASTQRGLGVAAYGVIRRPFQAAVALIARGMADMHSARPGTRLGWAAGRTGAR